MTQPTSAPNDLVGTWKLVSFQFEIEGSEKRSDVYDEHPIGFLIITADSRMMTVLTAGVRKPDAAPADLFDTLTAYTGRFKLENDRFITTVDTAWHPAWVGTEQTRFFKVDRDTLSIISPFQKHPRYPGNNVRGVVVWRKE